MCRQRKIRARRTGQRLGSPRRAVQDGNAQPLQRLAADTDHLATFTTGAKDEAGKTLAQNHALNLRYREQLDERVRWCTQGPRTLHSGHPFGETSIRIKHAYADCSVLEDACPRIGVYPCCLHLVDTERSVFEDQPHQGHHACPGRSRMGAEMAA